MRRMPAYIGVIHHFPWPVMPASTALALLLLRVALGLMDLAHAGLKRFAFTRDGAAALRRSPRFVPGGAA